MEIVLILLSVKDATKLFSVYSAAPCMKRNGYCISLELLQLEITCWNHQNAKLITNLIIPELRLQPTVMLMRNVLPNGADAILGKMQSALLGILSVMGFLIQMLLPKWDQSKVFDWSTGLEIIHEVNHSWQCILYSCSLALLVEVIYCIIFYLYALHIPLGGLIWFYPKLESNPCPWRNVDSAADHSSLKTILPHLCCFYMPIISHICHMIFQYSSLDYKWQSF